jgi:hypothetical protein
LSGGLRILAAVLFALDGFANFVLDFDFAALIFADFDFPADLTADLPPDLPDLAANLVLAPRRTILVPL